MQPACKVRKMKSLHGDSTRTQRARRLAQTRKHERRARGKETN